MGELFTPHFPPHWPGSRVMGRIAARHAVREMYPGQAKVSGLEEADVSSAYHYSQH